ncbi:MAG: phosphatidylglycerophosphatase A [Pyrinomonadaceae bacterium]
MKQKIERRTPRNFTDYLALSVTTFGVGYGPIMPGTYGSAVGVLIYFGVSYLVSVVLVAFSLFSEPVWPFLAQYPTTMIPTQVYAWIHVVILVSFLLFCLLGVWAAGRATELLGNSDPSEAVVDEVIGQLIVFLFVPFGISWPFILAGFFIFRIFDIWKPYPIDSLQSLPAGIGVCADDILAGVYAGICLAIIYAVYISL